MPINCGYTFSRHFCFAFTESAPSSGGRREGKVKVDSDTFLEGLLIVYRRPSAGFRCRSVMPVPPQAGSPEG